MDENPTGTSLRARLVVKGGAGAIAFYEKAFGATTREVFRYGDLVVSATLDLLGTSITLKDEDRWDPSPTTLGRPGVLLAVTTDDPDSLAARAVAAGATVVFEVADQDYGAREGRVRDPFGHEWIIGTPIRLTHAQVQTALDEMDL